MKMRTLLLSFFLGLLFLSSCGGDAYTYAEIDTDFGKMKVKLYNSTPQHRDNFIKLAKAGFYDGLLFHRVIKNFMIQGGDPDSKDAPSGKTLGMGGPGYTIPAEIGALHLKGALAAARTPDAGNPEKKSSGSQFYIVQGTPLTDAQLDAIEKRNHVSYSPEQRALYKQIGGRPDLDNLYTVYGEVVEGLDVIDKIAQVQTDQNNRPLKDVKMKVRILN